MKSIIVFVVLVSGSLAGRLSHEKKEKLFSYHQGCVSKSGVDRKIITQMKQGVRSEDPKFKEYLLCLSQKFGFQNEAGEFQREVMREKLTQYARNASSVDAVMEKCVVQKDSPLESAYHYSMCHYDICRDHGPLFYVINVSEKKKEIFHSYQKDCAAESGVNSTILENAQKEIFEDDPLLKKFAFCYSKKMGFQNENGKIDEQSFRGKLMELVENYDELEKLVSTCNVEKDNPENTAFEFFKCFLQNSHFNIYTSSLLWDVSNNEQSFRGKLMELVENYDELEKLVSTCNVEKDNPENTAFEFFKCFLQNSHFNVYTVTN